MRKRAATVLGAAAAAFMLATTPAFAADTILIDKPGKFQYERSCNNIYTLTLTSTKAVATKTDNPLDGAAWCAGHVWLRMMGDSLGDWSNDPTSITRTSPQGKFRWAYIKGCADCHAYRVTP